MPKYMLTRGQRRQPLVGLFVEDRNGTKITHKITYIFEPDKIVDTSDVTMDHWIESGMLVKVKDVVEPVEQVEIDMESVDEPVEPVVEEESESIEPEENEEEPEKEEDDLAKEDDGEEPADYEILEGGMFKCLHCDKKLKTEGAMVRHIESKH